MDCDHDQTDWDTEAEMRAEMEADWRAEVREFTTPPGWDGISRAEEQAWGEEPY